MANIFEFVKNFRKTNETTEKLQTEVKQLKEALNIFDRFADRFTSSWDSKFVENIYKDKTLYPHEEMKISKRAFQINSYVNSGAKTRANFLTGGTIEASSDDKATTEYLNKKLRSTGLLRIIPYLGDDLIITGNFYAERIFDGNELIAYEYIAFPERMYHDVDQKGFIKRYVQEIPNAGASEAGTMFTTIKYYGDRRKSVRGIELQKDKVFHVKIGVAEIPTYGRGYVASVTNDIEILLEIERAIAVISRYKAIPKKLIQLVNNTSGQKAASLVANMISNLQDSENPVVPYEMKVDDLSYSGKELNFGPIVEYLKKKITISLAPSYLMHGEETNYAVSRDQRAGFMLSIASDRNQIEWQLKRELRYVAKMEGVKLADFEIGFGDFDIGQNDDSRNAAVQMYQAGIITLNEVRDLLNYPEDQENGHLYFHELNAQSNLFGGITPIGEVDKEIESETSKIDNAIKNK